jgi:hypothetical protein
VSLDGIGEAFRRGALSLEFVEQASYHRFSSTSDETFEEIALRTGIPIDLVLTIRGSAGSTRPDPTPAAAIGERPRATPRSQVLPLCSWAPASWLSRPGGGGRRDHADARAVVDDGAPEVAEAAASSRWRWRDRSQLPEPNV